MTDNDRLKWLIADYEGGGCTTMCEAELAEELLQLRNLKHGVEEAIKEIGEKARRVVNKYDDSEISFSSGLYESITIIENHVSKYLEE